MQMQGTGEEVMDLETWGTYGGQRGPGAQVKMRGSEMTGGQVEHNYITYINDSSILSACCVTNTASSSPRLCHLVVTTTSKILIISLVNSTKDNDVH